MNITTHTKDSLHISKDKMRSVIQALVIMFVLILLAIMFMTGCSAPEAYVVRTEKTRVIYAPVPQKPTKVFVLKTYQPKHYITKTVKKHSKPKRYRKIRVYPKRFHFRP